MLIPGLGKVMENNIFPKVLEKSWKSKVASNIIYILANRQNSNTIMIINTVSYSNET